MVGGHSIERVPTTPSRVSDRTFSMRWALIVAALASVFVILVPAEARAYPFMIRHGYGACRNCHTDPSGGETLNAFGRLQGDQLLMMRWGSDRAPGTSRGFLWGAVDPSSQLDVGGSIRTMTIAQPSESDVRSFPMQADVYGHLRLGKVRFGGSVGAGRTRPGSPHTQAAQVTTNTDGANLISRSHWVGYEIDPEILVRAGRINLPFGVRMPEHVMWVRDQTHTDRESDQSHGVAVSYSGAKLRGEVMAIAGNYQLGPDDFRDRGYAGFAEYFLDTKLAVGVTSLLTIAQADRFTLREEPVTRQAHGLTGRWSPAKPLVLLLEADVLLVTDRELGYVGMLQADFEVVQGLHLLGTGELLDVGADGRVLRGRTATTSPGVGEPKLGGWLGVNWFFLPHLDLRVDALMRQQDPLTLLAQIHAYL